MHVSEAMCNQLQHAPLNRVLYNCTALPFITAMFILPFMYIHAFLVADILLWLYTSNSEAAAYT